MLRRNHRRRGDPCLQHLGGRRDLRPRHRGSVISTCRSCRNRRLSHLALGEGRPRTAGGRCFKELLRPRAWKMLEPSARRQRFVLSQRPPSDSPTKANSSRHGAAELLPMNQIPLPTLPHSSPRFPEPDRSPSPVASPATLRNPTLLSGEGATGMGGERTGNG